MISPTVLLIFGITGNLAKTKLIPALYQLEKAGLLPEHFYIFGTSRRDLSAERVESVLTGQFKPENKQVLKRLLRRIKVIRFDIDIADDYARLRAALEGFEAGKGLPFNLLIYLAIPPATVMTVVDMLAAGKLNRQDGQGTECRLLLEKPFGTDYASAKKLIKVLQRGFKEKHIYRIDHYLANETIQNIIAIREHNPWLKALWSAKHIKAIEISAYEKDGVEGRGTYYEQAGALRDMIQSHLLQLLAATTMHVPSDMTAENLAKARLDVFKNIRPFRKKAARKATRGQYRSYRTEIGVARSDTETFASVPITIDKAHWRHTRIRLSTGKALERQDTHVAIWFSDFAKKENRNVLVFRLQPEEGVGITMAAKKPGTEHEMEYLTLGHSYARGARFGNPYESVLLSAIRGERDLFPTSEEVLTCWKIINPLSRRWQKNSKGLVIYKSGISPQKLGSE